MSTISAFDETLAAGRDWQRDLYIHFHKTPELSMQEEETAQRLEQELAEMGLQTQRIGKTGVVAVIENGEGPVVLHRADTDGLPVTEQTGLEYASEREGLMHACGHDTHMVTQLLATKALLENKDAWSGTFICLFQPAEETAEGAQAMVDDDLVNKIPKPDVCHGQHVMAIEAGTIQLNHGPMFSQGDSVKVTIHGKGSHGSMPHLSIDPVVIASSIVVRLQSIVARVVAPDEFSVVTVGAINSGTKSNIIPDKAELLLNLRHFDPELRQKVIDNVERIIRAECEAGGCEKEPEIEFYDAFPLLDNDEATVNTLMDAFKTEFGDDQVTPMKRITGSEDFPRIADAFGVPYTYWVVGGFDTSKGTPPANHSPFFAPILDPTLDVMTRTHLVAAMTQLAKK